VTANLAGDWPDAPFQMDVAARLTPHVTSPAYHVVLTWAPDENPSHAEMTDAGHRAIYDLGGHEHQYILAIHVNQSGFHLHILLNRAHPLGGPSLSTSHDYALLEKACRRIEYEMGWPQDRGRFDAACMDGDVHLMPKPETHWQRKTADRKSGIRPDGRAVRGYEQRTGMLALRDAFEPDDLNAIRSKLDLSQTWAAVHTALAEYGLRYVLYHSGARIARMTSELVMAACHLGSDYGLRTMQRRLGRFVAQDKTQNGLAKGEAKTLQTQSPGALLPWFAPLLERRTETNDRQIDLRAAHKAAWKAVKTRQIQEIYQLRQMFYRDRSGFARAASSVLRDKHGAETRNWKAQNPKPDRISQDTTPMLDRMMPDIMIQRGHRHVLRARPFGSAPPTQPAPYTDHTEVRQVWALAAYRSACTVPERIKKIVDRFPADIRADGSGRLLCAQRNLAGSIAGFDVLESLTLTPTYPAHSSFGEGTSMLGPQEAKTIVIVSDVSNAIAESISSGDPHPLILVTSARITPESQRILKTYAKNRDCVTAIPRTQELAILHATLKELIPNTVYRKTAVINAYEPRGSDEPS